METKALEKRINSLIFFALFCVVITLDLNFFWRVGNATYPEIGVLLMTLFFTGHIARTFIQPVNIYQSLTFPLLSIISIAAMTMSLVFISGHLQQSHNASNDLIIEKQQALEFAKRNLEAARNNSGNNEKALQLKIELNQLKNKEGFKNSNGHVVSESLLKLTNNCQGGTNNSNWYLKNRAEMKAGCQRISEIETLLSSIKTHDIQRLQGDVQAAQVALNEAKKG